MIGCYIIEPDYKEILGISISKERKNMFVVAEHFLSDVVDGYGSHPVSIRFPQMVAHGINSSMQILEDKNHHIHSPFGKSIIERVCNF